MKLKILVKEEFLMMKEPPGINIYKSEMKIVYHRVELQPYNSNIYPFNIFIRSVCLNDIIGWAFLVNHCLWPSMTILTKKIGF